MRLRLDPPCPALPLPRIALRSRSMRVDPLRRVVAKLLAAVSMACTAATAQAAPQSGSPPVALPPGAISHDAGDALSMNGMPLRITVFTSTARPAALVQWFRASLGQPLTLDTIDGKTILGRQEGKQYITIQLQAAGSGTRGLLAVGDIAGALRNRMQSQESEGRWATRLPVGTRILNRMQSRDGNRQSDYLVASNGHSEQVNVEALSALLGEDGLVLERDAPADPTAVARSSAFAPLPAAAHPATGGGRTLFYRGRDKEAMAVIARDEQGNTALVISRIHTLEPTR